MTTTLKVGLSANIQNCNCLSEQIASLLSQDKPITIDVSELCDADLSFAQLIYATVKHANSSGQSAVFYPSSSEYLSSILMRAGLSPSLLAGTLAPCLDEGHRL